MNNKDGSHRERQAYDRLNYFLTKRVTTALMSKPSGNTPDGYFVAWTFVPVKQNK